MSILHTALVVIALAQATPHAARPPRDLAIYHVLVRDKLVALTFDDGPSTEFTPKVLEILNRYQVKATFFLVGAQVVANQHLAKELIARGHAIGNHTWGHPRLWEQSPEVMQDEIQLCQEELERVLVARTPYFRPPEGLCTEDMLKLVRREHYTLVMWTVALEHKLSPSAHAEAQRVLLLIQPGDIILAHDGGPHRERTVEALPLVIAGLQARDYRLVTIPELIAAGKKSVGAQP